MTTENIYTAINLGVMPAWVPLVFAPRWHVTNSLVHSFVYPFAYGALYTGFLVASIFFGLGAQGAGMASVAGVSALFSAPAGVLTGWTHYLVFDLFVGAWIGRDSLERNISHRLIVPVLALTFLFGPVGLFLYGLIRLGLRRGGMSLERKRD